MRHIVTRSWIALGRRCRADGGQDLLEYGLLASLIAIVAVGVVTMLGQKIHGVLWTTIVNNF
jgi:Flp pilus assembly pilin Flp